MRLQWFGPNVGYEPEFDPFEIARGGFNSLALVVVPGKDVSDYFLTCRKAGLSPLACIAGGSFGDQDPEETGRQCAERYGELVDVWTLLNEADGRHGVNEDGSQNLDDDEASRLIRSWLIGYRFGMIARQLAPRPVFAVGTVTGQPDYFEDPDGSGVLDLTGCTGLDNHAYAQDKNSVWGMLGNYDQIDERFGFNQRVIREFGEPGHDPDWRGGYVVEMVESIQQGNDTRHALGKSVVVGMWPYCWDASQHGGQFYLNDPRALDRIRSLGYGPSGPLSLPASPYRLGYKRLAETLGYAIVGQPIEQEVWPVALTSELMTSRGLMSWVGPRWEESSRTLHGPALKFYEFSTRRRYVLDERSGALTTVEAVDA